MGSSPELVVESVTGVDVTLPIAGPGARSLGFIIDWHIRLVLAVAWYVVAAFIYNDEQAISPPLSADTAWFVGVMAPAAAIYFLYHPVLEIAMRGRTPGKRMAGTQIVNRRGEAPTVGALLTRNIYRLIDALPVAYTVGLVTAIVTRQSVRIGDLAAGTLLVYSRTDETRPERHRGHSFALQADAASLEIADELLQRWMALDMETRDKLGRRILTRFGVPTAVDDEALHTQLQQLVDGMAR